MEHPYWSGYSVLVIFRWDEGVSFIFASYWSDAMVGGEVALWSGVDGGGATVMGDYRRLKPSASNKALQLAGYKFVTLCGGEGVSFILYWESGGCTVVHHYWWGHGSVSLPMAEAMRSISAFQMASSLADWVAPIVVIYCQSGGCSVEHPYWRGDKALCLFRTPKDVRSIFGW